MIKTHTNRLTPTVSFPMEITMSCLELWIELIKIFGAILAIYLVIRRLRQTQKIFKADHLRRKNESTLNAYNSIRDSFREINNEFCSSLNIKKNIGEPISEKVLERIKNENDHREKIVTLLGYIQRLAVGVKHDIYQCDVLSDLSGRAFINVYRRLGPYIEYARTDNDIFYQEAGRFIAKLESMRSSSNLLSESKKRKKIQDNSVDDGEEEKG